MSLILSQSILDRSRPLVEPKAPRSARRAVPRVLVGEDDREMLKLVTCAILKESCEVVEARDGIELLGTLTGALDRSSSRRGVEGIDLVVSDVRMPGLSGLEVLRLLRKCDRELPFLLISAFADERTHEEARSLGASALLDKPFDLDTLREVVRAVLRGRRSAEPS